MEVGPDPISLINCYRPSIEYTNADRIEEGQQMAFKAQEFQQRSGASLGAVFMIRADMAGNTLWESELCIDTNVVIFF